MYRIMFLLSGIVTLAVICLTGFLWARSLIKSLRCRSMNDDKLLSLPYETLECWQKKDLVWLLSICDVKIANTSDCKLQRYWIELHRRAKAALCNYL